MKKKRIIVNLLVVLTFVSLGSLIPIVYAATPLPLDDIQEESSKISAKKYETITSGDKVVKKTVKDLDLKDVKAKKEEPKKEEPKKEEPKFFDVNINQDSLQGKFLNSIKQGAVDVAKRNKIFPSVLMAQALLESESGQSGLSFSCNNLFGIKGDFNGQSAYFETSEDDGNGNMYQIVAPFRVYPSFTESMEDYAQVLRNGPSWNNSYYSGTWTENASSYVDSAFALTGTYATDTNYGTKLITIIENYGLHELDKNVTELQ